VFVVKLNATGSLLEYGTYIGGNDTDEGLAIALDLSGSVLVTGQTASSDFPTTSGAFDTSYNGIYDAFVARLNPSGSALDYSTYLGGQEEEVGNGIVLDGSGNAYVAGTTTSADFPTTAGAFDTTCGTDGQCNPVDPFGPRPDAFVTVLHPSGSALAYSTFLGGTYVDYSYGIAVNSSGNAFVTGGTESGDFPTTPGAFDLSHNGAHDVFLAKLSSSGSALDYATFLGGQSDESGAALLLDAAGNVYLTGHTHSPSFPVTPDAFDTSCGTDGQCNFNNGVYRSDAFLAKFEATLIRANFEGLPREGLAPLNVAFSNLSTGSFDTCIWDFGDGAGAEVCTNLDHLYGAPGVYTVTLTISGTAGMDTESKPGYITVHDPVTAAFSAAPLTGTAPLTVTFANLSTGDFDACTWTFGDGGTSDLCTDPAYQYTDPGAYTVTLAVSGPGGTDTVTDTDFITVYEPVTAAFSAAPLTGTAPLTVTFANLSTGDFDACAWTFGDGGTSDQCAGPTHLYASPGSYTVTLAVSGPGGTDTLTETEYITVYQPVTAAFTATPTSGTVPLLVDFTNLSSGDYDTCLWEFGDGQTSTDCHDPSHLYAAAGVYTVSLTVTGPGGTDTAVQADYIVVELYRVFLPIVMEIPQ
jgi:large repetitive protein